MAPGDMKVRSAKPEAKAHRFTDGEDMALLVHPDDFRYWWLSCRFGSEEKMLALGEYPEVSLVDARGHRDEARKLLANGVDPGENKKAVKVERKQEVITFEVVVKGQHVSNQKWSASYSARILKSLEDNFFAAIGKRNIVDLEIQDLLIPIKAVESSGRFEVAARSQQHTTATTRFAVQSGLIDYNPTQEIASVVATAKRRHCAALEPNRTPELLQHIYHYSGRSLTRLAVELTLLVFICSDELRFARWPEVDFDTAMWTILGERESLEGVKHSQRDLKIRAPHPVPLSRQTLTILEKIRSMGGNCELIFAGDRDSRKPMSRNTLNKALRVMGYDTKTEVCRYGLRTMACSSLIESGLWSRGRRLIRAVSIFTESPDQSSRATDRVPGLPASPGYVQ